MAEELSKHEKKAIIIDKICRVLTSRKDETSECILGREARIIVECWFNTVNSHFGGKSPEECMDMDYEQVIDYIDYLDRNFSHESGEETFSRSADENVRHVPVFSK